MEIITQEFTYSVPDLYLTNDVTENKTGTITYHGPDEMWVFVNAQTGKLNWGMHCLLNHDSSMQETAKVHAGEGHKAILINFNQNPLICWAMWGEYDEENASVVEFTLEGETEPYFTHFDPLPPLEIYDYDEFTYLFDQNTWKTPYPMRGPLLTKNQLDIILQEMIDDANELIAADDVSEEYTEALENFKLEVEALPSKYADEPYYIWPMPEAPQVKRGGLHEPEDDVPEEERWVPATDGSEGPGPETNYEPVTPEVTSADDTAAYPDSKSDPANVEEE